MKASELAIRVIETIAVRGDFQIHPTTKVSGLFYADKPVNMDYLDLAQVKELTHLSRTNIYLKIQNNQFPKPLKFGERKVRWKAQDVNKWLQKRKTSWDD